MVTRARQVIVTADDLGASHGVNRGVFEAHRRGIVTAASLMTDGAAAAEAADLAKDHPELDVGLHVDLGEWVRRGGVWVERYSRADTSNEVEVRRAVSRQVERFEHLVGRPPSHLDSHQHVHRQSIVGAVLADFGSQLGVSVRERSAGVRYRGDFYGQDGTGATDLDNVAVPALVALIESLEPGCTELGCHPGYADDLESDYAAERAVEVATLCDPAVRAALRAVDAELIGFRQLTGHRS